MNYAAKSSVFVILLTLWCSGNLDGKMLFDMTPPGNMYLPSGSNLELHCSITNSSLDANLIHIDKKYDYNGTCDIPDCDRVQFERFSNDSGFRVLTIRISNVTIRDGGTYYCFYGDPPGWESFKKVLVADSPSIPETLSCISHNLENLQCYTPFKILKTDIRVDWTLDYHFNRTQMVGYKCNPSGAKGSTGDCVKQTFNEDVGYSRGQLDVAFEICSDRKMLQTAIQSEFNPFPDDKILDCSNLIDVADNKSNTKGHVNCSYIEANNTILCPPFNISEDYYNHTVNILLVGQNANYNVNISNAIVVLYDFSIVKPNPVRNLGIHHTNGSEVVVFWDILILASNLNLVQRLELVSLNNWRRPQTLNISIQNNSLPRGDASFSHRFTNLIPNDRYTVSIQWKPEVAHGEKYWSFPTYIIFLTHIAVPRQSVTMTNGSFIFKTTNTSETELVLYWKNPDDRFSHGNIDRYKIEIKKLGVNNVQLGDEMNIETQSENKNGDIGVVSTEITGKTTSAVLHNKFNRSFAYRLEIWAGNRAGYSLESIRVQIPTWNEAEQLRPRWVVVERDIDRDRAFVSWSSKEMRGHTLTYTTVYSCVDEKAFMDTFLCKNFGWKRVKVKDTRVLMNTSIDHRFSVSVESSSGLSGGMVWQSLSFIYGRVPDVATYIVNSDPINHTVLNVSVVHGDSNGGRPETYKVFVTETPDIGSTPSCPKDASPVEYEVDFSKSDILLTDLKPGNDYVVCMTSHNKIGDSSLGMPIIAKTSSAAEILEDRNNSLAIGLGICLTLILLCVVICVGVLRLKQTIRKSQLENRIETIEVTGDQYQEGQPEDNFSSAQLRLLDVNIVHVDDDLNDKDSGAESVDAPSPEPQQLHEDELEQPLVEDQEPPDEVVESCQWSVFSDSSSSQFISQQDSSVASTGLAGYQPANDCSSGLLNKNENQDFMTSNESLPYGSEINSSVIFGYSSSGDFT